MGKDSCAASTFVYLSTVLHLLSFSSILLLIHIVCASTLPARANNCNYFNKGHTISIQTNATFYQTIHDHDHDIKSEIPSICPRICLKFTIKAIQRDTMPFPRMKRETPPDTSPLHSGSNKCHQYCWSLVQCAIELK